MCLDYGRMVEAKKGLESSDGSIASHLIQRQSDRIQETKARWDRAVPLEYPFSVEDSDVFLDWTNIKGDRVIGASINDVEYKSYSLIQYHLDTGAIKSIRKDISRPEFHPCSCPEIHSDDRREVIRRFL